MTPALIHRFRFPALLSLLVLFAAAVGGCDGAPKATGDKDAATAEAAAGPLPPAAFEAALPEAVRARLFEKYTGDLDGMVARGIVRVGVPYNRTFYFVDRGQQRGVSYEMGKAFEAELNKTLKGQGKTVQVAFIAMPRDQLAAALIDGKVDLVAAQVPIRPELEAKVGFSNPTRTDISEVVVTGPGGPASIATADDLSGKEVWVRADSKYKLSLEALNARLRARGRPPVVIREAPGNLEDDDLLEMVNAGLMPITVVDDYLADFWKKTFTDLTVHETAAVRTGGSLGVAVRKGSPQLTAALNDFLEDFGLGTAFGNVVEKRYLVSTTFTKNATAEAERAKLRAVIALFEKYGDQYDVDYLLVAAQAYQESQLDHARRSPVGAIGIMQVMPKTGQELDVGDISEIEPNIHAGVKYMRFMIDRYYKDEPMDRLNKGLFAFASYNAGPARVRQLRQEAEARGLDPNVWFGNVEQIAAERIGPETVTYVSNIYKYYVAYKLVAGERAARAAAREEAGKTR